MWSRLGKSIGVCLLLLVGFGYSLGCATTPGATAGEMLTQIGLAEQRILAESKKYFDDKGNEISEELAQKIASGQTDESKFVTVETFQETDTQVSQLSKDIARSSGIPWAETLLTAGVTLASLLGLTKSKKFLSERVMNPRAQA